MLVGLQREGDLTDCGSLKEVRLQRQWTDAEKAALGRQKSGTRVSSSAGSCEAASYRKPSLTHGLDRAARSSYSQGFLHPSVDQASPVCLFHSSSVYHGHRLCLFHLKNFRSLGLITLSSTAQAQRGSFLLLFPVSMLGTRYLYALYLDIAFSKREVITLLCEILWSIKIVILCYWHAAKR